MANNIVQLTDYNDDNVYPIAGGATQGSITKTMLAEGVFEGPELSEPSTVAYVATDNIQDGAVTTDKIADGAVTSDKIGWATIQHGIHTFNGTGWESVSFNTPFNSIPTVIATANTGAAQTALAVFIKTAGVTRFGFEVAMGTVNGYGPGAIHWIALPN